MYNLFRNILKTNTFSNKVGNVLNGVLRELNIKANNISMRKNTKVPRVKPNISNSNDIVNKVNSNVLALRNNIKNTLNIKPRI